MTLNGQSCISQVTNREDRGMTSLKPNVKAEQVLESRISETQGFGDP